MAETNPVLEIIDKNEDQDQETPTMNELDPLLDKIEESSLAKQQCCQGMTIDGTDNKSSPAKNISPEKPTLVLKNSNSTTANITILQERLNKSNRKIDTLKRKLKTSQQQSRRLKKKVFSKRKLCRNSGK